ncbi:MAG: hypothetical protein WC845_00880 [Candidatus Staskawiczbacteria bacterium]|jgi:hypothetical protein
MSIKKIYLFPVITLFLLSFAGFCTAATLEVNYPSIPGGSISGNAGLPEYALYVYKFGMLFGFLVAALSLVIAGIYYIFSAAVPSARASARDRLMGTITGTILLSLVYLIVVTINPELSIFRAPNPVPIKVTTFKPMFSGVNLYKEKGCVESSAYSSIPITSSIQDLIDFKRTLRSLKITPDTNQNILYFALTHGLTNFKGECQYFWNNGPCENVDPFSSITIYQFEENPKGNGVTFYREPFFDAAGGSKTITNDEIKNEGVYNGELKNLTFADNDGKCTVPESKQDCKKWDKKGEKCLERTCPNLVGKNIGSIRILGDYIVSLLYWDPIITGSNEKWIACQMFPTVDDVNKKGPIQLKWEYILTRDNLPNWVVIFPIRK